jgi:Leucine-rich repeat (LRR) protein
LDFQFLSSLAPSLRSLDLSHNQLADLTGSSLERLSNLQVLRIHHNKISSVHKSAVSGLANIQIVDLSSNQVRISSLIFVTASAALGS